MRVLTIARASRAAFNERVNPEPTPTPHAAQERDPLAANAMPRRSAEHVVLLAGATAALGLLALFALFVKPDPRGFGTHEALGLPPCLPIELWNVPCPGCGVTTSVALAAHGHVGQSFANQPFGALLALSVPFAFAWAWVLHLRGRDLRVELGRLPAGRVAIGIVVVASVAWLYKLALVRGWLG